jgi:hypothetical protein
MFPHSLFPSDNEIGEDGMRSICNALEFNSSLDELHVDGILKE